MEIDKIENLLVNQGLYDGFNISDEDVELFEKRLSESEYSNNNIDCFCVGCQERRVFDYIKCEIHEASDVYVPIVSNVFEKTRKQTPHELIQKYLKRRYTLTYRCGRDKSHYIYFDLLATSDRIIKIGQYPTVADLQISDIKKYKKVLGDQAVEYSKAIGLFAHGIGIGSFVYLRRIIEKLVFDKYSEVSDELDISSQDFVALKFEEKINVLKDYLPAVLVENKGLYGIVSKGIHELSEDECKSIFPNIQIGIEMILDDILAERERKEKEKRFSSYIADTVGKFKNNK